MEVEEALEVQEETEGSERAAQGLSDPPLLLLRLPTEAAEAGEAGEEVKMAERATTRLVVQDS